MREALLHIGASKLQENSLKWAKEAGIYVIATDISANPPSKYLADEFYNISGTNVKSLLDLAQSISKKFNLIGVYCNSDFSLTAAAQINKKYELRGCNPDSVKLSIDKNAAKEMMVKNNIPVPQGVIVDDNSVNIKDLVHLQLPLIIKPLDSSGSQGVIYINNYNEIKNAIDYALKFSKKALIEEFIKGDGVDTIGIMRKGKLFPCGLGLRFFSDLPFRFPIYGYTSSLLSRSEQEYAYRITEQAANAVGISDGPVKADLLFYERKFTLIEVTPRFHGDVFTNKTLVYASDFNPTKELFNFLKTGTFSDKSIFDIEPKLILWKGLFPLVKDIDWSAIKSDNDLEGNILDLYLDPRYKFKKNIHTDNTTLSGFMFLEFKDIHKIKLFLKKFNSKYNEILI